MNRHSSLLCGKNFFHGLISQTQGKFSFLNFFQRRKRKRKKRKGNNGEMQGWRHTCLWFFLSTAFRLLPPYQIYMSTFKSTTVFLFFLFFFFKGTFLSGYSATRLPVAAGLFWLLKQLKSHKCQTSLPFPRDHFEFLQFPEEHWEAHHSQGHFL